MIIYNITVKVALDRHKEWVHWMKTKHMPDVVATGYFTEYRLCRLLNQDDSHGITYAVQYTGKSIADYNWYLAQHAQRLQQERQERYGDKALVFRTLLEVVAESN